MPLTCTYHKDKVQILTEKKTEIHNCVIFLSNNDNTRMYCTLFVNTASNIGKSALQNVRDFKMHVLASVFYYIYAYGQNEFMVGRFQTYIHAIWRKCTDAK